MSVVGVARAAGAAVVADGVVAGVVVARVVGA